MSPRTDTDRKSWDLRNFHSLIQLILSNTDFSVVTVGLQEDVKIPFPEFPNRIFDVRDTNIRETFCVAKRCSYSITPQSGIACMMDCLPEIPGVQINIGSPKEVAGRLSGKIVNQIELFNPGSVTVDMVWSIVEKDLKEI